MADDEVAAALAALRERVSALESAIAGDDGILRTERLDVVAGDGGVRASIANGDRSADVVIAGEVLAPGRDRPGMIFFNDLGDECGGLTFGARYADDGRVEAWSGLTLDRFRHDQVIAVGYREQDGQYEAGLRVVDRPAISLVEAIRRAGAGEEGTALFGAERMFVGRTVENTAIVELRDGDARPRLRLSVAEGGAATIEFLAGDGTVQRRLTAEG